MRRLPALQLYKDAGVPSSGFTGVPVFQAQGLTVKTERSRYTPLFLAKEDLDVAVGAAFSQREAAKEAATQNKAAVAEEELTKAKAVVCGKSYTFHKSRTKINTASHLYSYQ
jgi:hypothetical protein